MGKFPEGDAKVERKAVRWGEQGFAVASPLPVDRFGLQTKARCFSEAPQHEK
jgi:hypothetical protein